MPVLLIALVAWALFAFGGAYRWTLVPLVAGAALLVALARPRPWQRPHALVDGALTACLVGVAVQLAPLPVRLHAILSPSTPTVDATLQLVPPERASGGARVLSLDPTATAWALATGLVLVLVFWAARWVFERDGGARLVSRAIAWMGLVLGPVALVAHWTAPRLIYGFWTPITQSDSPTPYGPFVNRNHFATWLALAVPLVAGYAMTRVASPSASGRPRGLGGAIDDRLAMLVGSLLLMTAALLASLSRSGVAGLIVGLVVFCGLGARRLTAVRIGWLLLAISALVAVSTAYMSVPGLLSRLEGVPNGLTERWTIWRDTWSMTRDFLVTGVGVGGFERGMLVYQRGARDVFFNHAHNHYLQWLAEGGVMLAAPAAVALVAATSEVVDRLRGDRTAAFWLRAGAASALGAVAVQSLWEVGLVMPANAVLFAVIAAIAVRNPGD